MKKALTLIFTFRFLLQGVEAQPSTPTQPPSGDMAEIGNLRSELKTSRQRVKKANEILPTTKGPKRYCEVYVEGPSVIRIGKTACTGFEPAPNFPQEELKASIESLGLDLNTIAQY